MPTNLKRGRLGSFNVFYKPETSKKCKGVPFDKIRKFSKKSRIVPKKNPKGGGTLWSHLYFWKHKKIYGLVRESNPRSLAWSKMEDDDCKKSGPLRVRLSTEKNYSL